MSETKCGDPVSTPVADLIPNPRNPNQHSSEQIAALAKIIEAQGWRAPIVVSNLSGFVVAGHGRLEAAKVLGLTEVPVDRQDFKDEAHEWAQMVADNRIAELAEIDNGVLKDLLTDMDTGALDMDLTGYDNDALENLMTQFHVDKDKGEQEGSTTNPTKCPKCGHEFSL